MRLKSLSTILTAVMAILFSQSAAAQAPFQETVIEQTIEVTKVLSDSTVVTAVFSDIELAEDFAKSDSLIPMSKAADVTELKKKMSNFMMGLEVGTGLDLSGTDMSTFNFDLMCGYRHKFIQLVGFGAGVHKSLGTRDTFIPLYAVFRTGFTNRPTLAFFHLSVGYSFNTISSSPMFGDTIASIGGGINLVQKPKFQSNIILAFGYRHFSERHQELAKITKPNIGFAQISFGISM